MNPGAASLLRLYLNADGRFQGKPLNEAVVARAQSMGLAGASVFTGEIGYGSHRIVHDAMSEYSFVEAPVVVELVDSRVQIEALLSEFQTLLVEGLVTISSVSVVHYVDRSEQEGAV
jgi:PII-like signaling protein